MYAFVMNDWASVSAKLLCPAGSGANTAASSDVMIVRLVIRINDA